MDGVESIPPGFHSEEHDYDTPHMGNQSSVSNEFILAGSMLLTSKCSIEKKWFKDTRYKLAVTKHKVKTARIRNPIKSFTGINNSLSLSRRILYQHQLNVLKKSFKKSPYLIESELTILCTTLSLGEKKVKHCFGDMRYKLRVAKETSNSTKIINKINSFCNTNLTVK